MQVSKKDKNHLFEFPVDFYFINIQTMKTLLMVIGVSLVVAVSSYAKESVYIGLSAPMSGQYSYYGKNFKHGIDLAIDKINNEGGVDGRPFEF